VLDLLFEVQAPFSPAEAVRQVAGVLKQYGLSTVTGDRYASGFIIDAFAAQGVTYKFSERDRSTVFTDALPLFVAGCARLTDNKRVVSQLAALERKTSSGGRDKIDHPRGQHDDAALSVCGALVLAVAKALPKQRLVVLAMGELGFPTRVLSPVFGAVFSYAAPIFAEGTAAGQVSARFLRHLYRVEKLAKSARIYGVIADPVRHSISPAVHNRAFQSRRVDAVYLPFLVTPSYLRDFFSLAEKLPLSGFSVTIPHKQKIIRYLDAVDPLARRIGAVNTVWRKAGKWRGTNTDAAGVTGPLSRLLRLPKSSILIVGNGGAARSAACALSDAGAKIALVGRNVDRVRALSKVCGAETLMREQLDSHYFDAVVHATPLGMYPHVNECFFNGRIPADVVFDMVYNPMETVLVRNAREQGKTVVPGLNMFIEQAVRQFEIWTGETAPRIVMEKAALEALEHSKSTPLVDARGSDPSRDPGSGRTGLRRKGA